MLRIALCEDDPRDRLRLYELIESVLSALCKTYTLDRFVSGESFLSDASPLGYDIVLLDVEMGRMSGIEVGRRLRNMDRSVIIIYTTSHPENVFSSFSVEPFQYLLKPISYDQLEDTFRRCLVRLEDVHRKKFVFSNSGTTYSVPVDQILCFQSEGRKITLQTIRDSYSFYGKLNDVAKESCLDAFIRCHQSFLINPGYVERIRSNAVILTGGMELAISKGNYEKVKQLYMRYIMEDGV